MTLGMLYELGIKIEHDDRLETFHIPKGQRYEPFNMNVEGDWSGAASIMVAGAVAGDVRIRGLKRASLQPDRSIINVLKSAGVPISVEGESIVVQKTNGKLKSFNYDATQSPDLIPVLVALATNCEKKSIIHGANRLISKESNRAKVLVSEFNKIGGNVFVDGDTMTIEGRQLTGGNASSHGDHRIAMALAIAGLTSLNPIHIEGADSVKKSYPSFFNDLKSLGANIK